MPRSVRHEGINRVLQLASEIGTVIIPIFQTRRMRHKVTLHGVHMCTQATHRVEGLRQSSSVGVWV